MKKTRVKLTNYSGLKDYFRESATVIQSLGDQTAISFCDGKIASVSKNKLEHVSVKVLSLQQYLKIAKVGDWVRTNGDNSEIIPPEEKKLIEG